MLQLSFTTFFKQRALLLFIASITLVLSCKKEEEPIPKSSEKQITKFLFLQLSPVVTASVDESTKQITATVPAKVDLTRLVPAISVSAKASVSPDSGRVNDFTKPVTYTVTAEDGTKAQYTVTINRTKFSGKDVLAFSFNDFSPAIVATVDPVTKTIKATMPATTDLTKLKPTLTLSERATANPASDVVTDFSSVVRYQITAEDGSIQVYTAEITKQELAINIKTGKLLPKSVVYVSSSGGFDLKAVDAITGTEIWSYYNSGAASFMNPTIYDGNLIFNSYGIKFIDCSTGVINGTIPNKELSDSSPVVWNDVLYYGSGIDGYLRAFDLKTKKMKWSAYAKYWVNASPTIVKNTVVVSIQNGNALRAFDLETGAPKWEIDGMRGHSNPCVFESTIIASSFGSLDAYDIEKGTKKWAADLGLTSSSSPTVSDGIVYVGSASKYAYAINASNGNFAWKVKMGGGIDSSPIVAGDIVYFYCKDSYLYALDKTTGIEKWKFKIAQPGNYSDDFVNSSPVVVDGVVFIQGVDKVLYALNATTGNTIWQYNNAGYQSFSSPCVVDKNGKVYHSAMSGMTN